MIVKRKNRRVFTVVNFFETDSPNNSIELHAIHRIKNFKGQPSVLVLSSSYDKKLDINFSDYLIIRQLSDTVFIKDYEKIQTKSYELINEARAHN